MASVNFLYRSLKDNSCLNLRLLYRFNDKDYVIASKTNLEVSKDYWKNKHKVKVKDISIINKQIEIKEDPVSLRMILNYLTLSEYKDIIIGKSNWNFFQDVFETHGNVLNRYTQLGTMRNKLRHDNVLTKVERLDGEASIDWFNKCLIEYIN